jgi:hypothetical protein
MRDALIAAYPRSEKWRKRVTLMAENQVIAVYKKLQNEGRIK